jgi:hypothetical protein
VTPRTVRRPYEGDIEELLVAVRKARALVWVRCDFSRDHLEATQDAPPTSAEVARILREFSNKHSS